MTTKKFHFIRIPALGILSLVLGLSIAKAQDEDPWPLVFNSGSDQVQVFKPQPETFDGTRFTARAAVALQRPSETTPLFGAIWGDGILAVDRDDRMGKLTTFHVTDARFPGITDPAEIERIKTMLSTEIPQHSALIAIDWMLAALEEESQSTTSFDNTPPTIIYREKPSILLFIDGEPIYEPMEDTRTGKEDPVYASPMKPMDRVINTPFFVVRPKGEDIWLFGSGLWYSATDIKGPWTYRRNAPDYLNEVAQRMDTTTAPSPTKGAVIPEIVVSTTPAILVDLDGKPRMEPFKNTSLMYITNTNDDIFLNIPTQEYYLLASGRWYATKDMSRGPWHYVPPDRLPADFAQVPEGSSKDGILAHVSGTPAAREAVRDASIPQTARVDRSVTTITVTYQGEPQFQRIVGTDVYSAKNASTTVLRINGTYHVCDNAIWFEGNTPDGPWTVSTSVPSQVNEIPPSDPAYKVRYVYIYDHTPDAVFVGYTPGYLGSYVQGGTVIYGTGFYYDPWPGYWYARPFTWGYNMSYNPWYGWGFGPSWGYNWYYPSWGYHGYHYPYSWGWWGPYAYCPPVYPSQKGYYGHRPSMTGRSATNSGRLNSEEPVRGTDLYSNHRVPGVQATVLDRSAKLPSAMDNAGRTAMEKQPVKPIPNDHFTDRSGNVYRLDDGTIEQYDKGRWSKIPSTVKGDAPTPYEARPARAPTGTAQPSGTGRQQQPQHPATTQPRQPEQIQQERSRGDQRVNDYRGYRQQDVQRRAPAPPTPRMQQPSTPAPRQSPAPSGAGRGNTRSPR